MDNIEITGASARDEVILVDEKKDESYGVDVKMVATMEDQKFNGGLSAETEEMYVSRYEVVL